MGYAIAQQPIADDAFIQNSEFGVSVFLQPLGEYIRPAPIGDPSPSVSEEPNATMAAPRGDAITSTPVRNGQKLIVFATGKVAVAVESPFR